MTKTKTAVSPFLKWVGGKQRLLSQLLPHFPDKIEGTYHEPFLGGGAVFFALRPERARLSDVNNDLINAYKVVQAEPYELLKRLGGHQVLHNEEYFYRVREAFNERCDTAVNQAGWLIYLNKTAYNGLYRVNKKNEFNAPYGRYEKPNIMNEAGILDCFLALRQSLAVIKCQDFGEALLTAKRGDFIYFDPPYWPEKPGKNFTSYTAGGFNQKDQFRLLDIANDLYLRGIQWALSNSAVPDVYELYKNYRIIELSRNNAINSNGGDRGKVKELLILNY